MVKKTKKTDEPKCESSGIPIGHALICSFVIGMALLVILNTGRTKVYFDHPEISKIRQVHYPNISWHDVTSVDDASPYDFSDFDPNTEAVTEFNKDNFLRIQRGENALLFNKDTSMSNQTISEVASGWRIIATWYVEALSSKNLSKKDKFVGGIEGFHLGTIGLKYELFPNEANPLIDANHKLLLSLEEDLSPKERALALLTLSRLALQLKPMTGHLAANVYLLEIITSYPSAEVADQALSELKQNIRRSHLVESNDSLPPHWNYIVSSLEDLISTSQMTYFKEHLINEL